MNRAGKSRDQAVGTVRSVLHRLGYRFRLQRADLPGCPDVVLPRWRLALFVVDCDRHPHADCIQPRRCVAGDDGELKRRLAQDCEELERQGWQTLIVQACDAADPLALGYRLDVALQGHLLASPAGATASGSVRAGLA